MNKLKNKNTLNKGFTLIEMAIVIGVIGVLSGVLLNVVNSRGISAKSRDSQRISDMKRIQTALELYFADNRQYPSNLTWVSVSAIVGLTPNYISKTPLDPYNSKPTVGAESCFGHNTYDYYYISNNTSTRYALGAIAENDGNVGDYSFSDLYICTMIPSLGGIDCSNASNAVCMGVENPL